MSNFKKKITKHETKHKTSRNNDVCNDDGDDDSHCCDHHHSGESENRQDSQENIDQFPIIYGRHIHAEDEENETDANTTTVYLDKPPFSIPLINCMAERLSFSDTKVPKYEKLPQNANDLEFQFDENTGNVHCKNGIVLQKTHFIEGYGVLTKKYSEQRLAEIAYFFERLPAFMPPLLTGIYQAIDETREKRKICSIVDVLKILYVTPRYKQDLIVYPRLAKLIAFLTKQNDACDSAKIQYCDVDINNTTAETYISLTILVLEILFTGGERMLVLDDIMYNEVAVLMAGQEFWKFLHLCIPAFDWHFKKIFSFRFVMEGMKAPHSFQYPHGETMAIIIWLGFGQALKITTLAVKILLDNLLNLNDDDNMRRLVNQMAQNGDPNRRVNQKEKDAYYNKIITAYLITQVPRVLLGASIATLKPQADKCRIDPISLYLTKSVLEHEQMQYMDQDSLKKEMFPSKIE